MPNVASILKQEIARVARKEAKAFFKDLPSSFGSLKKTVSVQKKRIAALEIKVAKLEKAIAKDSKIAIPKPEELEHSRLGAKNIVKLRKKLDLTRAEMAKLVGSSTNSIFLWENSKATPRFAAKAKIIALRSLSKKIIRKLLGDAEPKNETTSAVIDAKPATKRKKTREAKVQPKVAVSDAPKQEAPSEPAKASKKKAPARKKAAKAKKPANVVSTSTVQSDAVVATAEGEEGQTKS